MATRTTERQLVSSRQNESVSARLADAASRGIVHIVLLLIGLIWLVPTLGLLITSFRPRPAIAASGWWTSFLELRYTFANYGEVLSQGGMGRAFLNSAMITLPATVLTVLVAALAAYGLAWLKIPGRDWIFLTIIAFMMVPIQMALIPVLRIFDRLGLTQSPAGLIVAHIAFGLPFAIFLLRNFFITLPRDLFEAAKIDGASDLGIFFRLVLPLSVPALASLTIFQFLWVWNDLLTALIFVQNPSYLPLTVKLNSLLSTYGTEWHLLSAGAFILMAVPLAVFFSLQRYFVTGLLAGSVK